MGEPAKKGHGAKIPSTKKKGLTKDGWKGKHPLKAYLDSTTGFFSALYH